MSALERIAPDTVIIARVGSVPVTSYVAYPPGTAPADAPIRRELHTLEMRTAHGSRWYGFTRAPWIGADLEMHVLLDDERDEVRRAWRQPS
jgi:hypothetical protein